MKNEAIILSGYDGQLSAAQTARIQRDELLALATGIVTVSDKGTAETCAAAMKSLKAFSDKIEDARVEVKRPVDELAGKIQALARELSGTIKTEEQRLGKVLGAYQAEQKRIAEEKERAAREEEARIWREAQEKERARLAKIAEEERVIAEKARKEQEAIAEKARKEQEEANAKAARSRSEAGREKALAEAAASKVRAEKEAKEAADRAEAEAAQRRDEEEALRQRNLRQAGEKMVAVRIEGANSIATKPAGVATRTDIAYEITNIVALYEACPYLVKMEENVMPLKAALKALQPGQNLPGVRHWEVAKTHVR